VRTIHHVFDVGAAQTEVYAALTEQEGLARWWTAGVSAPREVGGVIDFTFSYEFSPEMKADLAGAIVRA
jgi:uncharacterized protein YndB with AHSA1/START domain